MTNVININDFLKKTYKIITSCPEFNYIAINIRPRIICKDGFSFSCQASKYHYCNPRVTSDSIEYENVELGFPSMADDLIKEYAVDCDDYTNTIYAYVPIDIVDKLVLKHGGMDSKIFEKTIENS